MKPYLHINKARYKPDPSESLEATMNHIQMKIRYKRIIDNYVQKYASIFNPDSDDVVVNIDSQTLKDAESDLFRLDKMETFSND